MKFRFKNKNFSRKGNVTYCAVACEIETLRSEEAVERLSTFEKYIEEIGKRRDVFTKFDCRYSMRGDNIYKVISVGKAVKSITDTDNPKLAEKLAEARARLQCYRYIETYCNALFHSLKELAFGNLLVTTNCPECTTNGGLYDKWLYYQSLVEKEKYYISKLLSEL